MSAKIKVSYTKEEELQLVIQLLSPMIKAWKVSGNRDGRYRKAYIELDAAEFVTERNERSDSLIKLMKE